MRRYLALVCLSLPIAFAGDLDPALAKILPPDASVLLGIQWRKVMASSTGSLLEKRAKDAGFVLPEWFSLEKALREDIDQIVLAAPARSLSASSGQRGPALVVVRGLFGAPGLARWMRGKVERYRHVELIIPQGAKPATTRAALVDANTLLFGDRKELLAAIDRMAAPASRVPNRMLERAAELAAGHDVWVALEAPAGGFPGADRGPGQMLSQVQGLDLGISFSSGFGLQANLRAKSEQAARDLATSVQGLMAMAALGNDAKPETLEMLRKVQVATSASAVRISVSLSEAEVQRGITQIQTASAAAPAPAKPAAAPAGPRKIRILGLEGGATEVPVNRY